MKTLQIHQFIHDTPATKAMLTKKSGAIGRPARGKVIGVMVAQVMSAHQYRHPSHPGTHPGHEVKGGYKIGGDKFDKHIAITLALGKIMQHDRLPSVITNEPTTKRAAFIRKQFVSFDEQAAKVFADKTRVS